ncbi:14062_t:CDS:2, partial [Racocetra fulgida]
ISITETLSDENHDEYDNNHVTNSMLSKDRNESDSATTQITYDMPSEDSYERNNDITHSMPSGINQLSKPNLKDLQLVPINKAPGKSNFIGYLVLRHAITEALHKQKLQQDPKQQNIDQVFQKIITNDPKQKTIRDQKFVSMLVKDQLPINIQEGTGFNEFLAEFDPNYQLPSERLCQRLLTDAFLSSKKNLKKILNINAISCSLTCDLWTERN